MTQLQAPDLVDQLTGELPVHPSGSQLLDELRRQVASYRATPLTRFRIEVAGRWRDVWLKLEGCSPWGSIKGRTAVGLLGSIAGSYQPGRRLIESSSGNLGVALAGLARACGAELTVVVDERLPTMLRHRMADFAVELMPADPAPGGQRPAAPAEHRATAARRPPRLDAALQPVRQSGQPARPRAVDGPPNCSASCRSSRRHSSAFPPAGRWPASRPACGARRR